MMRCNVTLLPAGDDDQTDSSLSGDSGDDGTFIINGVHPGRYRIAAQAFGGYISSLASGTQDLSRGAELVIGPGTPPEPLEIVLRSDGGTISGTVDESMKPSDDAGVVIAPAAGGEIEHTTSYLGKFEFEGIAPGDYVVYLVKDMRKIEYRNPEVLRTLKGGATVHVTAGGSTTVKLKAVAQ